jgi:hypothetical protein
MEFHKQKFFPHFIKFIGVSVFLLGISNLKESPNSIPYYFMFSGFFIYGLSGIFIIRNKSYSYGFMEIKGLAAKIYGFTIIVIGWGLSILSIIKIL